MEIPTRKEFLKGISYYERREKRDAMYKIATFHVQRFWGNPSEMANGLGVLLLNWNQAFYRFGSFDFDKLENCIAKNIHKLNSFRKRNISTLSSADEYEIKDLFTKFLKALQIDSGKKRGTKSPVAVAKALHLLAPNFFPLWDHEIASAYGYHYNQKPADNYFSFCNSIKTVAGKVKNYIARKDKTVIRFIDEYNYSRYTQGWV